MVANASPTAKARKTTPSARSIQWLQRRKARRVAGWVNTTDTNETQAMVARAIHPPYPACTSRGVVGLTTTGNSATKKSVALGLSALVRNPAVQAARWDEIVRRYPIRESGAVAAITSSLGFSGPPLYLSAVMKLLREDPEAASFARTLLGGLAEQVVRAGSAGPPTSDGASEEGKSS